jgi:hypothetical protein
LTETLAVVAAAVDVACECKEAGDCLATTATEASCSFGDLLCLSSENAALLTDSIRRTRDDPTSAQLDTAGSSHNDDSTRSDIFKTLSVCTSVHEDYCHNASYCALPEKAASSVLRSQAAVEAEHSKSMQLCWTGERGGGILPASQSPVHAFASVLAKVRLGDVPACGAKATGLSNRPAPVGSSSSAMVADSGSSSHLQPPWATDSSSGTPTGPMVSSYQELD